MIVSDIPSGFPSKISVLQYFKKRLYNDLFVSTEREKERDREQRGKKETGEDKMIEKRDEVFCLCLPKCSRCLGPGPAAGTPAESPVWMQWPHPLDTLKGVGSEVGQLRVKPILIGTLALQVSA